MFKKKFEQQTINEVRMGNGTVAFQGVKLNVHCFFIDGILIDTGAKSLERYFKPFFKELDIEQVVITHYHEDHTGCASFLQKELGLPIFMNDLMIDSCKQKADYPLYRQLFWGRRKPFQASTISDTFQSANASWKVISTPGHAVDHVSFLNQETGQLFTGDLYVQEKTKVVLREENIPHMIDSLQRILTYSFDEVFCSHSGRLIDGRSALKRKLEYLLELQGNILKLHQDGKDFKTIQMQLFPRKYPITRFSNGEWDSIHMIKSVIQDDRSSVH